MGNSLTAQRARTYTEGLGDPSQKEQLMKTAGVVLDFYDDLEADLLKRTFPTTDVLPEAIKTAHILSSEEREVLRDEAFALVMTNEGKTLRKFACVDPGNTLLSALYLTENADKLPEEALKIASANVQQACEFFKLPIESLEKIAGRKATDATNKGLARQRDPMRQPLVGDEADWNERTNLVSVRGGADSGRVIPTANQMKTAAVGMGLVDAKKKLGLYPKASAPKTASSEAAEKMAKKDHEEVDYLKDFHKLNPEADPKKAKKKESNSGCGPMKTANAIDVSGLEAPVKVKKASAQHMALGQYPLDSYADVEAAVQFFEDNHLELTPEERHDFAVKTASRADELGIPLTELLDRYGSVEYSVDVEAHISNRRLLAPDHTPLWNELQEKRASIAPEEFAKLLGEADEAAGLNWYYGGHLADPFFATFGGNKAKTASVTWSWQSRTGDYVSADQLKRLALDGRPMVEKQFTKDLADAFSKSPIAIFESLPDLQKKILARLASQEFDGLINN